MFIMFAYCGVGTFEICLFDLVSSFSISLKRQPHNVNFTITSDIVFGYNSCGVL